MIKARLNTFDVTMIVVSLVIGIGIFRTPAMVASATGTPALFFAAWIAGGLITLVGALTFAEIGARFPQPGSYYKVVAESYNSLLAFMLNWANVFIINTASGAGVALIGAEYLTPVILPERARTSSHTLLLALAMVVVLLVLNYIGIKSGARTQNILSLSKIILILALALAGLLSGHSGPEIRQASLEQNHPWWLALGLGFISVFFSYGGYQQTINLGADLKDSSRNLPRAVIFGMLIVIGCYLLINLAYWRVLGLPGMSSARLVAAETARAVFGPAGYRLVSLAIFLSALGFLNAILMQLPRTYLAMAEDRTLPGIFKKINPRTQVQEFGLLFLGAFMLLSLAFLRTFENIVNYVMFLDSLGIAVVASTIFVLRARAGRRAENYRGFRVPGYPVLPALFIFFLLSITINVLMSRPRQALLGSIFLILGFPLYLAMRRLARPVNDTRKTAEGSE
ncbi:MAG: amino acid permease [Candidatus Saccharicenans sp.]|nr:amino acid permease [Candidatus Saccharicenans sp.]MDI6849400.1 amino acid permease [Candidatus Saccharicenans sp.]